jgi:hypothetical protein
LTGKLSAAECPRNRFPSSAVTPLLGKPAVVVPAVSRRHCGNVAVN